MRYADMTKAELEARLDEIGVGHPRKATKAELVELLEQEEAPIEVEAVAIEESVIPANALAIDVDGMQAAALELTEAVDAAATALGEYDVGDETLESMPVADVRICEDGIAAALRDVDERRKELTRMLTGPKKAIDEEVKKLTGPLSELARRYADRRQAIYMEGYRAQYEECCIANGLGKLAEAVPFDAFMERHGQWTARTANPVKTQEKISDEVNRIARDWEKLRGLRGSMRHYDEAEREFFATLDIDAAIERDRAATAQQERIDAMRREREEAERWQAEQAARVAAERALESAGRADAAQPAPEPVPTPQRPAEPATAPQGRADGRRRYHFEAWMDDAELASLREWKNACGVGEGWTFREVR